MNREHDFIQSVSKIAVPVTLQCLLSSSFSVVDQIMIGQLGSVSITAVGLAGKFHSMHSVIATAIASVAGIMIAQYLGMGDIREVKKSISVNLIGLVSFALLFTLVSFVFANEIMGIYTLDPEVRSCAVTYLRIISFTYIFRALSCLGAVFLRCLDFAKITLLAGGIAAGINTLLNYILIFGKCGFQKLGANGAGIATVIAQVIETIIVLIFVAKVYVERLDRFEFNIALGHEGYKQYFSILAPIFITEFLWSLGENAYSTIYGHLGTIDCAAMTLISPIICLTIGSLSGLASAAGIIVGKNLGAGKFELAFEHGKKLILYGLIGALILSGFLAFFKDYYVLLFNVEEGTREIAVKLIIAFAMVSPIKTLNMILTGGIIRSGGKTKLVMIIDIIGTWVFGVPLGLLSAYVFKLPIYYVYFILSQEELIRLIIGFFVFFRKNWMKILKTSEEEESKNECLA